MASQGPLIAGTGANDATWGDTAWFLPTRVTAEDGTATTCTPIAITNYIKATNFGFSIPAGATINGIQVEWKRASDGGVMIDSRVRIVKGGTIGATDKSTGAIWTTMTLTWDSFGGATELWGHVWTDTDINASTFGAVLAGDAGAGDTGNVDACRITVYYTAAAGGSALQQATARPLRQRRNRSLLRR